MADFESTSVETPEVAEPAEETGVEDQEVAAPESETEPEEAVAEESGRTSDDAAWARMRREKEQAQAELDAAREELNELRAQTEARDDAFSRLTGSDDGEVAVLAEVTGMTEDEVRAELEAAREAAEKDIRIAQLEQQVDSVEAERLMQADLEALRRIDPSLKSLEDLGDAYLEYVSAGLPPERAYWAIKAEEQAKQAKPPKAIGKVATGTAEKDYFTDAEIDAMSSEQLTKNWKKIMNSWGRNNT